MPQPIAAGLIDALHAGANVPPGCRVNHARGLLVEGRFLGVPRAAQICAAPLFDGADQPLIVRFSDSGPDPRIAQDSPAAEPRGLALRIGQDSQLVLVGHSLEGFPARDPETFLAFIQALNAQQAAPESLQAHLAANPEAQRFGQLRQDTQPAGYASRTYHMLHPYRLAAADGRTRTGRLTITGKHADGAGKALAGPDCMDEALRHVIAAGPVALELAFTPAPEQGAADDLSTAWPGHAGSMLLGYLILERIAPDQDAQRALVFDPSILPAGIEFAGDPLLTVRLQAYRLAAERRLRGVP
ncbi:catalase [Achromobacter pestifer]|uniref:catalase n=1 Tax=Achromobacter pestifer TaxID=1353889 RepID=A0A7D4I2S2_9BURK|nr:catalase [Achromobacter pestifer]QKH38038.1 catalase [Achromobacter pestifer]